MEKMPNALSFQATNPDGSTVKRRQRTHAASGGASEALPHEVGARPSRSEPKLNTHALYPSRSELRGITFKNKQNWAKDLIDQLIDIKETVDRRKPIHCNLDLAEINDFEDRYDHIIERAKLENPPPITSNSQGPIKKRGKKKKTKAQNLLERLQKYRREVLAFMYDFEVPFDNNQAERDLRMMKVQQKISGNFRSWDGAKIFCRIRGYISTVKKNSSSVIDAIQGVFEGKPFIPQRTLIAV